MSEESQTGKEFEVPAELKGPLGAILEENALQAFDTICSTCPEAMALPRSTKLDIAMIAGRAVGMAIKEQGNEFAQSRADRIPDPEFIECRGGHLIKLVQTMISHAATLPKEAKDEFGKIAEYIEVALQVAMQMAVQTGMSQQFSDMEVEEKKAFQERFRSHMFGEETEEQFVLRAQEEIHHKRNAAISEALAAVGVTTWTSPAFVPPTESSAAPQATTPVADGSR